MSNIHFVQNSLEAACDMLATGRPTAGTKNSFFSIAGTAELSTFALERGTGTAGFNPVQPHPSDIDSARTRLVRVFLSVEAPLTDALEWHHLPFIINQHLFCSYAFSDPHSQRPCSFIFPFSPPADVRLPICSDFVPRARMHPTTRTSQRMMSAPSVLSVCTALVSNVRTYPPEQEFQTIDARVETQMGPLQSFWQQMA